MLVIQTGGTIDKAYPRAIGGYAFEIGEAAAVRVLRRVGVEPDTVSVCRKDSQDVTPTDRTRLLQTIEQTTQQHVLVTHGTDTLIDTAHHLGRHLANSDKVVVLTGAKLPETFKDTDADFNLGVAVGALQFAPPGVYVAMQGAVHSWDTVARDSTSGHFSSNL